LTEGVNEIVEGRSAWVRAIGFEAAFIQNPHSNLNTRMFRMKVHRQTHTSVSENFKKLSLTK